MPIEVALFPWQTVLFPGTAIPIHVSEGAHLEAVRHCLDTDTACGVVLVEMVGPGQGMLAEVGTLASIQDHVERPDGAIEAVGVGTQRFRILEILQDEPYILASAEPMEEPESADLEPKDRESIEVLTEQFQKYAELALPKLPGGLRIRLPSDPVTRLNLVCSALVVPLHQKQQLLEEGQVGRRAWIASAIIRREVAELEALRATMKVLRGDEDAPPGPYPFSRN